MQRQHIFVHCVEDELADARPIGSMGRPSAQFLMVGTEASFMERLEAAAAALRARLGGVKLRGLARCDAAAAKAESGAAEAVAAAAVVAAEAVVVGGAGAGALIEGGGAAGGGSGPPCASSAGHARVLPAVDSGGRQRRVRFNWGTGGLC